MKAKEILTGLGGFILWGVITIVGLSIAAFFIYGTAWASTKLLPWFSILTWIAFSLVILILLPLAIPKATRGFSSTALFVASYVFGATLWMEGFLITYSIWGVKGVFIGLVMGGIGVIPIAILATILNGMWLFVIELVVLIILTFGCRFGSITLMGSLEE